MTVAETILVFVGAPLLVVLILAAFTLGPGVRNRRPRYKPGQPWTHEPIWYEPHPESTGHGGDHGPAAAHGPAAVPGDSTTALGSSVYPEQPGERALDASSGAGPMGEATGGRSAGRRPHPGGPLGGARGTW